MDQKKTGHFLKQLRNAKGLTQEQLAEQLNVTGRTISRWETGINMPDLDILMELADFYQVELRELIDGERVNENMNKEIEETVLKVAEYSNEEKNRLMTKLHYFSWIGVIAYMIFIALEAMGMADEGITEIIASFCSGLSLGMLVVAVIYTSRYINRFRTLKKRIFNYKQHSN